MFKAEIKHIETITLATLNHTGDYMNIGKKFEQAYGQGAANDLLNETTRGFGVYFDNPEIVPLNELRSKAGFTVNSDFSDIGELTKTTVQSGKYAITTHKGSYEKLLPLYDWLFDIFPKEQNQTIDSDKPCVEEYLNDPNDTPEEELLTIVMIPLKA